MATGVNKLSSVLGLAQEVTEGTYVAPTAYIQPLEGFSTTATKEELEREVITAAIGNQVPRTGIESATASLPLEWKANGVEGDAPEADILYETALGNKRQVTTNITTKVAGHTTTTLPIEDADIGDLAVGDIIVILESGDYTAHFITARDDTGGSAFITYSPARSGAPSASVQISQSTTYYPANSGHPSFSLTTFYGDEIEERTIGGKVTSMALENFTTGQVPSMNFSVQGMSFVRQDGSSAGASYTTGLPPVILGACVYQDGSSLELNEFTMTLENEITQLRNTCATSGVTAQRVTSRNVSFTMNPYMDDTTLAQFTLFDDQTLYSLIVLAYTPDDGTNGITLGSVCGIYLPACLTTSSPISDVDNILVDQIEGRATAGTSGTDDDIYLGFV